MSEQEYNPPYTEEDIDSELGEDGREDHERWALRRKRARMVLSRFQALAILREQGFREQVEALIDDPETDPLVVDAWHNAQEFRRTSPTIAAIAKSIELDDEEVDAMFVLGAKIEA